MLIVGLTGSIGMGKTTAAQSFRSFGVSVHDADAQVHTLMSAGGQAVALVAAAFPGVATKDHTGKLSIDRQALGDRVFGDDSALKRLENILHPLVGKARKKFLESAARQRQKLVVLDIPLLLETGGETHCDVVVVVSAPPFVQKRRVLQRPGMTLEKMHAILARQMPDVEKRRRADFVVRTGLGRAYSLRAIGAIVKNLKKSTDQDHA